MVLVPTSAESSDPRQWLELIEDYGVTVCGATIPLAQAMVDEAYRSHPGALATVRLVVLDGDSTTAGGLAERIRWHAPRAQVLRLSKDLGRPSA